MKKFIFVFFIICTSFSYGITMTERDDLNIIINSEKISLDKPLISYNNYTLASIEDILPYFNVSKDNLSYSTNTIFLKNDNSILTLYIGNINGYIDGNIIHLPCPPIVYKNNFYIPLRVISDFYNCYTYYDTTSKTIFIKNIDDFIQIVNFFNKIEKKLNNITSLQIDTITELQSNGSSYALGNSLYINKDSNIIYEKSMLNTEWKEYKTKINYINYTSTFNSNFFIGLSFDKKKSSETQMIFYGYYLNNFGELRKSTFYIDTNTFYIIKHISEIENNNVLMKQTSLYTYNC